MQVKIGGKGQITKCGEFMMVFNETPDMSILSQDILKEIEQQQSPGGGGSGPGGSISSGVPKQPQQHQGGSLLPKPKS